MESKKLVLNEKIVTYLESSYQDIDNTLLFLHGWMQNKETFSDILACLDTEKIAYISVDLPGFGGTGLISDTMQIEDYGKFVCDFIEKKGLQAPTLIGHSFGGRISIYLGSFYKNISRLLLIGTAGIAPKMNPLKLFVVKAGKAVFSLPGLRVMQKYVRDSVSGKDYKTAGNMTKIYRNTISNDLKKYMRKISLPVLMVFGKDDDQVPLHETRIIHSSIPGARLEVFDGTHFIHQEKPKEVAKLILQFIQK